MNAALILIGLLSGTQPLAHSTLGSVPGRHLRAPALFAETPETASSPFEYPYVVVGVRSGFGRCHTDGSGAEVTFDSAGMAELVHREPIFETEQYRLDVVVGDRIGLDLSYYFGLGVAARLSVGVGAARTWYPSIWQALRVSWYPEDALELFAGFDSLDGMDLGCKVHQPPE